MTLILKMKKFKLMAKEQCFAFIKNAVNVGMDEVIYSNGTNKTFITDGLATCAAVAIYGSDSGCSAAFTHMSSEASDKDDKRKETILNEMLEYVLKSNALSDVKLGRVLNLKPLIEQFWHVASQFCSVLKHPTTSA
ncbi:TPA: hypothetical protein ACS2XB_002882 [Legionella pneumophila]